MAVTMSLSSGSSNQTTAGRSSSLQRGQRGKSDTGMVSAWALGSSLLTRIRKEGLIPELPAVWLDPMPIRILEGGGCFSTGFVGAGGCGVVCGNGEGGQDGVFQVIFLKIAHSSEHLMSERQRLAHKPQFRFDEGTQASWCAAIFTIREEWRNNY